MLFFLICAAFALFPEKVLCGAQSGVAICINSVIPSLLPFMLVSSCIIKSRFSRPLGVIISKIITPITKMSTEACVCFVVGLLGGYGAGARAVAESCEENLITKEEAQCILPFCNNPGPLFVMGTVGVGFFSSKETGMLLYLVQIISALLCARVFAGNFDKNTKTFAEEWNYYKKNKPAIGGLITKAAYENVYAVLCASVFIVTFGAITEILPFGKYQALCGILEVTRAIAQISREGREILPCVSALLSWGGMSVHFQANALCENKYNMKKYYMGKLFQSAVSYLIAKALFFDISASLGIGVCAAAIFLILKIIKYLLFPKFSPQRVFRQRRRS